MTKILYFIAILSTSFCYSLDLSMENGTFNRCGPDLFYDSVGEFGNYSDNESFTTTICPQNADEFSIINFIQFSTQLSQDILTIYDGDDITAVLIGTYSGVSYPDTLSASDTNTTGCLTFVFTSNGSLNMNGLEDEIFCATTCQDIVAFIDYPLYFTPNGDGNHDIWNVPGIGSNAKIYIFDRYGKLLKQLSPRGAGRNGTFNGHVMPTSDYWFMVEYNEPMTNERKEFNAHFTLKR